ncbi:MAG: 50S ribosomal protein L30e [Candidatus Diapherotrites archaeon]
MAKIDVNKELRRAVDTGKVFFGQKQAEKSILKGKAQLIIISGNIPKLEKEKIVADAAVSQVPFIEFGGSGLEMGSVCGKPFVVSVMVVVEPGKSAILKAVEKEK